MDIFSNQNQNHLEELPISLHKKDRVGKENFIEVNVKHSKEKCDQRFVVVTIVSSSTLLVFNYDIQMLYQCV